MRELIIQENEAGQRLDKFLGKYLSRAPVSFIYRMLRKKNIVLNGKKAGGGEKISAGDSVKLFLADETIEKFSAAQRRKASARLDIIYEDSHVLLINKPAGMLSQKAKPRDDSLTEYLESYLVDSGQLKAEDLRAFHPSVCNRLDRNTSGIVTAGKSLAGLQEMGELFRNRKMRKYYRCIVSGEIREKQYVRGYLTKDNEKNQVRITTYKREGSLPIETEYTPLTVMRGTTLLEVHLITGRTHQIRAHLSSCGHPIIGDGKYGDSDRNRYYREKYGLAHQLLHAYRLEFPETAGILAHLSGREFCAPLPDLFHRIMEGESIHGNMEQQRTSRFNAGRFRKPDKRVVSGTGTCPHSEDPDSDHAGQYR